MLQKQSLPGQAALHSFALREPLNQIPPGHVLAGLVLHIQVDAPKLLRDLRWDHLRLRPAAQALVDESRVAMPQPAVIPFPQALRAQVNVPLTAQTLRPFDAQRALLAALDHLALDVQTRPLERLFKLPRTLGQTCVVMSGREGKSVIVAVHVSSGDEVEGCLSVRPRLRRGGALRHLPGMSCRWPSCG